MKEEVRACCDSVIWTDDGFINYIAKDVLIAAVWEDLITRLDEWIYSLGHSLKVEYKYYKGRLFGSDLWEEE